VLDEDGDREWKHHWANLSEAKRRLFDETYTKGLQIAKKDPEFQNMWTHYIDIGELPPKERHPDIEWNRLATLWKRKPLSKQVIQSLEIMKRIREEKK
jgi:hypothetical protein